MELLALLLARCLSPHLDIAFLDRANSHRKTGCERDDHVVCRMRVQTKGVLEQELAVRIGRHACEALDGPAAPARPHIFVGLGGRIPLPGRRGDTV